MRQCEHMNIAFIVPGFSTHAAHFAIPALQNLLVRFGKTHRVTVFSLRYPENGVYEFQGIQHIAIGGGLRMGVLSGQVMGQAWRAIMQAHRAEPFDLIHAFWADESGFVGVNLGIYLKIPVVVSASGGEMIWFPEIQYGTQGSRFRRWLVAQSLRRADVVTVGSAYQQALVHKSQPRQNIIIAPLGIDHHQYVKPDAQGSMPDTQFLIQAASLEAVKNQTLLLQVLALAREKMPALRLHLAGEGSLQASLMAEARRLGVFEQIVWHGKVPFLKMPAIYQQSHLYVQTSLHEAQGMSVVEGLTAGVPAIGTPVGLLPQVGALPPVWSAEALAGQVVELLGDEGVWQEKCRQARQMGVEKFSFPVVQANFEAIYQRLIS